MLRTSLFLALTAAAGLALAQSTSTAPSQTRPSSAPPANVAPIEAGSDQPVTVIPERPRTRITEKKAEGGQVTEVQVQSGKSHYTLRPRAPAGNAQPGTVEAGGTRAPLWTVKEFDILGKKKKEGAAEAGDSGDSSNANAQPPAPPAGTSQPPAANNR